MDLSHGIVLALGFVGSSVIHCSQGLMKLAVHRRLTGDRTQRNRRLYFLGLLLNFLAPLWVVLANRFGPTVLYTSMYASGLLLLILFSRWKLGRLLQAKEFAGAGLLILGSVVLVVGLGRGDVVKMESTQTGWLLGAFVLLVLLLWPVLRLSERWTRLPPSLILGSFGGAFLALDSLLKGIAQADGGTSGFLPDTGAGWALFVFSFIGAGLALGLTQWAHRKGQSPTATIAAYDAAYVSFPILLLPLAQQQAGQLDPVCWLGLIFVAGGLVAIGQANKNT